MTRIQLIILVALIIIIGALSYPPWAQYRKVSQADIDVEILATAIKKYYRHTQTYPTTLDQLVTDPDVDGWRGTYLQTVPKTPWGGNYVLMPKTYKVGIEKDHPRVPAKYRLGGIAEISKVYHADAKQGEKYWW
ncbi:MAG: type II secretion system protein GspG [Candidatus Poribacteria bacterium]|nr:type II secretion system protein GspG [Candidatus Poribacteria bacterium]